MSSGGKTRVGRGPVPRRSLTDKCGQSCTRSRPSSVSSLVVNQPLPGFGPFHGHSCKAKLFLSLLFWDPLDFASYELMFKELYSYEEVCHTQNNQFSQRRIELRNEDADQIMFKQCRIVRLVYQSKLKMLTTTLPKNKLTCQFFMIKSRLLAETIPRSGLNQI